MLFMMQGRLTRESLQAFVERPIDRQGPASQTFEEAGASLQQMYQTAEGYVFAIFDAPTIEAVTAASVSVQAINRLTDVRLHRLQTTAEFIRGIQQAKSAVTVNQFPG